MLLVFGSPHPYLTSRLDLCYSSARSRAYARLASADSGFQMLFFGLSFMSRRYDNYQNCLALENEKVVIEGVVAAGSCISVELECDRQHSCSF